jgi:hypothetical protein
MRGDPPGGLLQGRGLQEQHRLIPNGRPFRHGPGGVKSRAESPFVGDVNAVQYGSLLGARDATNDGANLAFCLSSQNARYEF